MPCKVPAGTAQALLLATLAVRAVLGVDDQITSDVPIPLCVFS